jgi:SAM-dependent methyltransferase
VIPFRRALPSAAAVFVLALAAPSGATGLSTPVAYAATTGSLVCDVGNVGKKPISVAMRIVGIDGVQVTSLTETIRARRRHVDRGRAHRRLRGLLPVRVPGQVKAVRRAVTVYTSTRDAPLIASLPSGTPRGVTRGRGKATQPPYGAALLWSALPGVREERAVGMTRPDCPLCGGVGGVEFFHQASVPTNVIVLFDDPAEARAWPRGSLRLRACPDCGLIANADVDPALIEYSARIEETQAFSPHFAAYADALADRWIARHGLAGKRVLEIGCGKGEFLASLCRKGVASAIGFDPAARPDRIPEDVAGRLELRIDYFDERHLDLEVDAIVCRHTLEHVPDVAGFLSLLRRFAARRATPPVLLFEVPETQRILAEAAFWDLYYEHCAYFTRDSLQRAFEGSGFRVLDLASVYDDQYLLIEAAPAAAPPVLPVPAPGASETVRAAQAFGRVFTELARRAAANLAALRRDGPLAVWGGGAKGCSFLTALEVGPLVDAVVDVNPHKQGKYLIGTGHPVIGPEALRALAPAHVVVMNPVYLTEIGETLRRLGIDASLHGANDVLAADFAERPGRTAALHQGNPA